MAGAWIMKSVERGWRDVAAFRGRRSEAFRCAFALKRSEDLASGEERRSGASSVPAAPLRQAEELARIERALNAMGRRHGQRCDLRFERVVNHRELRWRGERTCSSRRTWALSGAIGLPTGGELPVGWSGGGDGIAELEDEDRQERLDRLGARVGEARCGETGPARVLLSAQAAAVLLHEAIGHFAEAPPDTRLNLSHRVGMPLAEESLLVCDDPSAAPGAASYRVDDEGVESIGPTELVREGRLQTQLHSHGSAACARTLPTANARAALWSAPLPRMSNLICAAGRHSFGELVEQVWNGLLIHHLAYGYAAGAFVGARVVLAEVIERGRLAGRFVTGLEVAERQDLFLRAEAVGDRCELNPNAMCGKAGQLLFDVGTSAPAIALSRLELRR